MNSQNGRHFLKKLSCTLITPRIFLYTDFTFHGTLLTSVGSVKMETELMLFTISILSVLCTDYMQDLFVRNHIIYYKIYVDIYEHICNTCLSTYLSH